MSEPGPPPPPMPGVGDVARPAPIPVFWTRCPCCGHTLDCWYCRRPMPEVLRRAGRLEEAERVALEDQWFERPEAVIV